MGGFLQGGAALLGAGDHRIMRRVNRWRAPRWVRYWMLLATRAGDGWIWWLLGAALLVFGGTESSRAVGLATAAALSGVGVFLVMKRRFRRRRPCHLEPHCWSTVLPPDQFSFPSGHTITAFAISIPVVEFFPALAPELLFCAGSIAISRVVLGMHFVSDVMAGAVIGSAVGWFWCWIAA
jgi:undecaprenyl-diphosphatase